MNVIETSTVWLAISILYMGTAVYLHLRHRDILPKTIPFAFFAFGGAIFTVLNRSIVFQDQLYIEAAGVFAMILLLTAWLMAVWAVHDYVKLVRKYTDNSIA